jgi:hypothetical protein
LRLVLQLGALSLVLTISCLAGKISRVQWWTVGALIVAGASTLMRPRGSPFGAEERHPSGNLRMPLVFLLQLIFAGRQQRHGMYFVRHAGHTIVGYIRECPRRNSGCSRVLDGLQGRLRWRSPPGSPADAVAVMRFSNPVCAS